VEQAAVTYKNIIEVARMLCNFSLQVIIANCKNLVRQCSINSLHFHFKRILHISKPKTNAGIRTIPMLDTVKDAFEMLKEEQEESGQCDVEIDGMTGFIFCSRFGNVPNPQSVNRAIKRIIADYNATEEVAAKKQHREAVLLPDFSAHHLRHTFCTRLCENETNLKVIQSVMWHKDIQTTMDVYAEATEQKKQESFERLAAKLDIF
jgi:integrase